MINAYSKAKAKVIFLVIIATLLISLTWFIEIPNVYEEFIYTDSRAIEIAYLGPKTPTGFYKDRLERGEMIHDSIYYYRKFGEGWEFFATDDLYEARTLVVNHIQNSNVKVKEISETYECEKFFEFKTVENHDNGYTYILRYRVNKSSYIQLNYNLGIPAWWPDLNDQRSIEIGTFNQNPRGLSNSKEFIEYLWFSINYNYKVSGRAIYDEILRQSTEVINIIFLEVHLSRGDWDIPDVIKMVYSKYSISKSSGRIWLYQICFRVFKTGKL